MYYNHMCSVHILHRLCIFRVRIYVFIERGTIKIKKTMSLNEDTGGRYRYIAQLRRKGDRK